MKYILILCLFILLLVPKESNASTIDCVITSDYSAEYVNVYLPNPSGGFSYSKTITNNSKLIFDELKNIEGENIWIGYENGGWAVTPNWNFYLAVQIFDKNGNDFFVWFAKHPDYPENRFVFVFESMEYFADSNGEHYGPHPCRGEKLSKTQLDILYKLLRIRIK